MRIDSYLSGVTSLLLIAMWSVTVIFNSEGEPGDWFDARHCDEVPLSRYLGTVEMGGNSDPHSRQPHDKKG